MKITPKDIAMWLLWVPLRKTILQLPLRISYALASITAWFYYASSYKLRNKVFKELKNNLGHKYSGKELKKITVKSFGMYVKMHFENLILGNLSKDLVDRMVSIEGLEQLDKALDNGKGIILLISHTGSFLMVLPALGFKGYRVNQIARPPVIFMKAHNLAHKIKEREYAALPVNFIRSDKSLKTAINAIKKNEIVVIAFDGREGTKWVPVNFFGRNAYFSPGPVRIANITGAAILPAFIVRQRDNSHKLIIEKPVELEKNENEADFISVNLQRFAKIFEEHITQYPDHYGIMFQIVKDRAEKGYDKPLFSEE